MKKLLKPIAISVLSLVLNNSLSAQPLDFSGAYIKNSNTNIGKVTLDGVRFPGNPQLLQVEYVSGPNFSLVVGQAGLNNSPTSNIEALIRNQTFNGSYSDGGGRVFNTSLKINLAQDGFVAGVISHIGDYSTGMYIGRVAGYLEPINTEQPSPPKRPEPPYCPPGSDGGGDGPYPSSVSSIIEDLHHSDKPCKYVEIPPIPGIDGKPYPSFTGIVANSEAVSNLIISSAIAGKTKITGWRLYLKRLEASQHSNGTLNSWSSNREYILTLSPDGNIMEGAVVVPPEIVGQPSNPYTGSMRIIKK